MGLADDSEGLHSGSDFVGKPRPDCSGTIVRAWPFRLLHSRSRRACICRRTLGSFTCLILLLAVAIGAVSAYLAKAPIELGGMGTRIKHALNEHISHGYSFSVGPVSLVSHGFGPALSIKNLTLSDASGHAIISAPRAEVSVDIPDLLIGKIVPKRLEIFGIEMRLELLRDGSLAVSAGGSRQGATPLLPLAAGIGDLGIGRQQAAVQIEKPAPAAVTGHAVGSQSQKSDVPQRSLIVKRIGAALRLLVDMSTKADSPLASLDRLGIAHGKLVITDRTTEQTRVYEGLHLALTKSSHGKNFSLSAEGPNGTWSIVADASGVPSSTRHLDISAKNISIDEILLVTGSRKLGVDFDMPISSKFSMALAPDGGLTEIAGKVNFGSGYLRFEDPNDEPKMIDSIATAFHWDRANRRIAIDKAQIHSGGTDFDFKGVLAPPTHEGDDWRLSLVNPRQEIYGAERPGELPIVLSKVGLSARINLVAKKLTLDRFEFSGPKCSFAMSGTIDWTKGPHIRLGASIGPTQSRVAVRLWPSFMIAPVRSWFLSHWKGGIIESGSLRVDFDAATIAAMKLQHAPPDKAVALDFTVSKGVVEFLPGVPPLHDVEGTGHITGRTSTFIATSGRLDTATGGQLVLSNGSFRVFNAEVKPTPAQFSAQVAGSVEAVGALLNLAALKPYASLPIDPTTLQGKIEGTLGIGLRLGPVIKPKDTKLTIDATATDLTAQHLIGKESLEDATLHVLVGASGMKVTGQGQLFGAPASIDIEKPIDQTAMATVSLVLDDAERAKHGLGAFSNVTGPITAKITTPLGVPPPIKANIDLDLTHAAVVGLPGIAKAAGRPGKASFILEVGDKGTQIQQLLVDAAPIEARGSVQLGSDGSMTSARFSQVRFSPGDDMKVDVAKSGNGYKMIVRATTFDARPFLQHLTFAKKNQPAAADADDPHGSKKADSKDAVGAKDFDIDLKSAVLKGYNKTVLSNVDLRIVKQGDKLRQFSIDGRFGHAPISGYLVGANSPSPQLNLSTRDAGSLLAFLDLYKHMEGGQLSVAIRLGNDALAGALRIKNFILRDEPALRRLVVEGAQQRPIGMQASRSGANHPNFDPNSVAFSHLQVNFQRAGDRLDIRNGTMYGADMGLTVDGWLDFARDRVSMDGTFVPAYGVNNLFSQVPLFGPLLGGGAHEGLFAVNYTISGAASKPTLNINPLSAIAPGFLRKILGAMDPNVPDDASNSFGSASSPPQ